MKLLTLLTVIAVASLPIFAQMPNGPHYNLNIIGVENPKTADMQGSNRHTIFVALGSKSGAVKSNIYLVPPPPGSWDFKVCDGNGFDAAVDCQGNTKSTDGAVFQLPCNTNISGEEEIVPCSGDYPMMSYEVWARALGKPGGSATMTTCATEDGDTDGDGIPNETICSTENVLLVRNAGKSPWKEVTNELTSLVGDVDGDGIVERVALFEGDLEDWFWEYANKGLRLAQLRFYAI